MIYILLPVHNRKTITLECINCINKQTFNEIRIILIDDGSTDGTAEGVIEQFPNTHILKGEGNWWWGGSLHQGYKYINSIITNQDDIILILNDDTTFDKHYLENGMQIIKNNENTLVGSISFSKQSNELIDRGKKIDWKRYKIEDVVDDEKVECLSTRGIFIPVLIFKRIGGFHPYILPHYLSDYEYTIRAASKGYKLICDNNLYLIQNQETTGVHSLKEINQNIIAKIKLMLSKKYSQNPFFISVFILLRCPYRYKLINLLRIWMRSVKLLLN
jgi:GT2 family glycosyltransferase